MKLFQIIIIIFCLGIFLIPKGNFYNQSTPKNCCQPDSTTNCCNGHKNSPKTTNENEKTKSSCTDDGCSSCSPCYTFIVVSLSKNLSFEFSYYIADKNLQFQYSVPYISDRLKEIWQPPKIA